MSRNIHQQKALGPSDDADIVSALVSKLSDAGIARSRIDAIINKAARPASAMRSRFDVGNMNARPAEEPALRSEAIAGR